MGKNLLQPWSFSHHLMVGIFEVFALIVNVFWAACCYAGSLKVMESLHNTNQVEVKVEADIIALCAKNNEARVAIALINDGIRMTRSTEAASVWILEEGKSPHVPFTLQSLLVLENDARIIVLIPKDARINWGALNGCKERLALSTTTVSRDSTEVPLSLVEIPEGFAIVTLQYTRIAVAEEMEPDGHSTRPCFNVTKRHKAKQSKAKPPTVTPMEEDEKTNLKHFAQGEQVENTIATNLTRGSDDKHKNVLRASKSSVKKAQTVRDFTRLDRHEQPPVPSTGLSAEDVLFGSHDGYINDSPMF